MLILCIRVLRNSLPPCCCRLHFAVKSWDGGQNTVDSSVVEGIGHKRSRDAWDEEMDRGKVKKRKDEGGKERRERSTADFHKNPFQDFQNWKNVSSTKWFSHMTVMWLTHDNSVCHTTVM